VRLVVAAVFTLALLSAPAADAAVPALVAAYGFEEATGTAGVDVSGAGNPGATRSATGRVGAALSFDGVNDVVTIADSNSLDLSSAMTLEAWVPPDGHRLAHRGDEGAPERPRLTGLRKGAGRAPGNRRAPSRTC
jgi:hypothetical protein